MYTLYKLIAHSHNLILLLVNITLRNYCGFQATLTSNSEISFNEFVTPYELRIYNINMNVFFWLVFNV